jgi:adenosine 3'-phospho 5'-phosphosulfate transporter B3
VGAAACSGTLGEPRKAPVAMYALQATVMAVYAAVAKIAYKYLNYATGTVLRSTKLVFVMLISVGLLHVCVRNYKMNAAIRYSTETERTLA